MNRHITRVEAAICVEKARDKAAWSVSSPVM